ncbi:glycine zipper domain-containing protein [Bdellovibrio sp. HCB337]|uniref:glycine zipper domain-containing protein n=1 Tax=Bdellovibrio sp. HCB337 TaxID=3394358 RepID=UPI0039A603C9
MEPTANELKNSASSAAQYASDKARQVASDVSDRIKKGEMNAQDIYQEARARAEDAMDVSVDFVKKHPFSTVAGAAAIGFLAGMLIRGNRH